MVLKEKTQEVYDYIKNNGGHVKVEDMMNDLGIESRSITARINALCSNKGHEPFAWTEKIPVEGKDKPEKWVHLTDAGLAYVPTEEDK